LSKVTAEDFQSEDWHNISPESVEEFLKMDCLDVEEADLARALVSWGRFQVHTEGGDPADSERLRSKILAGLRWIRFAFMNQDEFTQLCREELGAVLSEEEKISIIKAMTASCKQTLFPTVEKRKRPPTIFSLPWEQFDQNVHQGPFMSNLIFRVDKSADFIGLNSTATFEPFRFELFNAFTFIGSGSSEDEKITYCSQEYCQIRPKCTLTAGVKYNLAFTFLCRDAFLNFIHTNYQYFTLPLNSFTYNGLTLFIDSTELHVFVKSMLFVKSC
jgi:hypothetical protein